MTQRRLDDVVATALVSILALATALRRNGCARGFMERRVV